MAVSYSLKRIQRSWKLFLALLLGVVLASAFFAGINIGADSMAKRALDQRLAETPVDLTLRYYNYGDREHQVPSSTNLTNVVALMSSVEGVVSIEVNPVIYVSTKIMGINEPVYFLCAGIFDDSRVYSGMTGWTGKLGINETLINVDSKYVDTLQVGDAFTFNITVLNYIPEIKLPNGLEGSDSITIPYENYTEVKFPVNLTIAGFVSLTDEAYNIATGSSGDIFYDSSIFSGVITQTSNVIRRQDNICLVSWSTFSRFIDAVYETFTQANPFQIRVSVFLDRESIVNPWDIATSLERITSVTAKINNKVAPYGFHVYDEIASALRNYQYTVNNMRFGSVVTSLPIFFIAWYMASTVSSVSFNLRRREIGLLLSKGSSRGQLLRIFLGEAFIVGLIGAVIGVGLSFVLSPLFIELIGGVFGGQVVLGVDTLVMTTVFGVTITLAAIFQPARKASKLNPVDAIREYLYVEEVKPYRKALPLTALILGTFKIIILALGINLQQTIMSIRPGGNIFLMIILAIVMVLDGILTYIGPLLFFWGVTKVFIQGSVAFQGLSTRMMKGFLGDLGSLATRNVLGNPGRTASIAFLIALIIGYAFSVNGALASEQDYTMRQIYFDVGCSDISLALDSIGNLSRSIAMIENVSGISSTTVEYSFYGESSVGSLTLKAVNPDVWRDIGYYEDEWFIGRNAKDALRALTAEDATIILDYGLAKYLDLEIGDTITITFTGVDQSVYNLRIVGFFGSKQTQSPIFPGPRPMGETSVIYPSGSYWSYVSHVFFNDVNVTTYTSAKMLVELKPEVNSTTVVEEIRNLDPPLGRVSSVDEMLESRQSRAELSGIINIQRLGITFTVLAASIGIGLVTVVSLRERRKEISLINVRGASYKQSIITLLSENLAVVVFAIILGSVVGLIIVHGNIASANALAYFLVKRRIILSTNFMVMLLGNYLLLFISLMVPIIVVNRRYMSELGDAIRQG